MSKWHKLDIVTAVVHLGQADPKKPEKGAVVSLFFKLPEKMGAFRGGWRPGQYAFLRVPSISHFQWHPFTIASGSDGTLRFCIQAVGDWTTELVKQVLASDSKDFGAIKELHNDGIDRNGPSRFDMLAGGISKVKSAASFFDPRGVRTRKTDIDIKVSSPHEEEDGEVWDPNGSANLAPPGSNLSFYSGAGDLKAISENAPSFSGLSVPSSTDLIQDLFLEHIGARVEKLQEIGALEKSIAIRFPDMEVEETFP